MTDTLYYDGQCPLCSKEIRLLKRLQKGGLLFQDIHALDSKEINLQGLPPQEELLRILHVKTAHGKLIRGIEANIKAWSHTAFGGLFKLLLLPGLSIVSRKCYAVWAAKRYHRLYACRACKAME